MTTEEEVLRKLEELENLVQMLINRPIAPTQIITVEGLSDISNGLGTITSGEFRVGNSHDPGYGYSGVRMVGQGAEYNNETFHLVGVENDALQFGLKATNGKAIFAGGDGTIDEDGIKLNRLGYALSHLASAIDGTTPRYGRFEMYIPEGDTIPALRLSFFDATESTELVTNGGLETGDFTGWSNTVTSPDTLTVSTASPHTDIYSALGNIYQGGASPSARTVIMESSSGMSVTPGSKYALNLYQKFVITGSVIAPHKTTNTVTVRIYWYDSGGSPLSYNTVFTNAYYYPGAAYSLVSGVIEAPAGAATAKIWIQNYQTANFTDSAEWGRCLWYIDDFSFQEVGVYRSLTFSPDLDYSEGLWPEGATKFFSECHVYDTSDAVKSTNILFTYSYSDTGIIRYQLSPANGDYFTCNIPLKAGTYTFRLSHVKKNDLAKIDAYLDGVKINTTTLDMYASSTSMAMWTLSGITVDKSGVHELKLLVNGKNASSSNYYVMAEHITFTPEW